MKITMTRGALEALTDAQAKAILRLTASPENAKDAWGDALIAQLEVYASNPFDLPPGYFAFRIDYVDGRRSIYGGIAPDGDVST